MKNKQTGFGIVEMLIALVVIGLIGAIGYLSYNSPNKQKPTTENSLSSFPPLPPLVRGVVGPNVSAIDKYAEAPGLGDALKQIAKNNPCTPTEGRFKQIVLGVTTDKIQALVGNSCGSTGVLRTFMVRSDAEWKTIGSWKDETTRKDFSALTDTPSCDIVKDNNIQKSIAPVCFELREGSSDLLAGDTSSYSYVVR